MAEFDQRQARRERAEQVALDIIEECRVQLMLKFRFLDLALWRMPAEPVATGRYALATDGTKVYFEPYAVLARFQESFDELVRDYLHLVMHCIFRHPFDETHERHEAWWLACDVVAESVAMELCAGRFESELDKDRRVALSELRMMNPQLTPASLYRRFVDSLKGPESPLYGGVSQSKMTEYAALFERDNHEAWPSYAKGEPEEEPGDVQELAQEGEDGENAPADEREKQLTTTGESSGDDDQKQRAEENDGESRDADTEDEAQGSSEDARDLADDAQRSDESSDADWRGQSAERDTEEEVKDEKSQEERDWEEIAKQVEMNLDTFSKEWGDEAGAFIASLKVANRKRYDYSEFLRRFTMLSEEMKINDDEYDYIFYTYGMELYGNMPLVEPLEYKETQRIRDFVIAIDTSESCSGDLVRRFVEHTFDMMKRQEDFAHEVNIHIVQCDAKVQADTRITDLRDVDAFMEGFYVRGMGGTDFRPVFAYVQDLRTRGELADMKGLIYFTDGLGQFPDAAPDYDTAFVFMDTGEQHLPAVPPWAMRVVLDEEGISRFKSRV
ncbi:MAG TPA: hypothetical protein DCP91_02110 [Eggerthellaceae bacterium]|nr:hypothetical protein [Eggerthellaceae bacterium]